jgi:hypothetical protein
MIGTSRKFIGENLKKSTKIIQKDSRISWLFFLIQFFPLFFGSKMSLLFQNAKKKLINQNLYTVRNNFRCGIGKARSGKIPIPHRKLFLTV